MDAALGCIRYLIVSPDLRVYNQQGKMLVRVTSTRMKFFGPRGLSCYRRERVAMSKTANIYLIFRGWKLSHT
jgi:hypothetical protein